MQQTAGLSVACLRQQVVANQSSVGVDQSLFDTYTDEPNGFAAEAGNTLSVIFYGAANLDGKFNSSDLVQVLASGKYEDDIAGNAYWTEGDWNSDGDFDTADLIVAFSGGSTSGGIDSVGGRYEQEAEVNLVPEPFSFALLALSLLALLGCRSLPTNYLLLRGRQSGESFRLSAAKIGSLRRRKRS
ncbi:MAG: hypothetical protein P8N76_18520 [Pirellulaceae bacterium]|nr:hypothetical protein [Pirellulaceae bacterium]